MRFKVAAMLILILLFAGKTIEQELTVIGHFVVGGITAFIFILFLKIIKDL